MRIGNRVHQVLGPDGVAGRDVSTEWVQTHGDAALAMHEQGVLEAVRGVLPAVLGALVHWSTTALAAAHHASDQSAAPLLPAVQAHENGRLACPAPQLQGRVRRTLPDFDRPVSD